MCWRESFKSLRKHREKKKRRLNIEITSSFIKLGGTFPGLRRNFD